MTSTVKDAGSTTSATSKKTEASTSRLDQPTQKVAVQEEAKDISTPQKVYKNYYHVESTDRSAFRGIEFLLSCVGLAVGLGNIWRFPMVVYENGGSSFLIPYAIIILVFAIPSIHMEFALGQYAAKSPPAVFRRIMPIFEGLGWMTAFIAAVIAIYYMILLAWISVYLINIVHAGDISKCNNPWNNIATCYEGSVQKKCLKQAKKLGKMIFINGTCQLHSNVKHVEVSTHQFFENLVVGPSKGLLDINNLNWTAFAGLAVCWTITAIILIRGMKTISKLSYFTAILPYLIILILLARGISLDGAKDGLNFFLWKADFSRLLRYETWSAALSQACFSLSIGIGGLMNTASYNKRSYNWYRDAFLIVFFDTLMSLLGGIAVFSTLGFLAKQRGVTVPEVVKSGPHLAFVVYTEAISQMPIPRLWYTLFFVMLFLLGIGTEIVFVETVCSCFIDRFKTLRKRRWALVIGVCSILFLCGVIMTTDAGYYWFAMFDEYSGGVTATISATVTCLVVCFAYGLSNFRADIQEMWEQDHEPDTSITRFLGPASFPWAVSWMVTSPLCSIICLGIFVFTRPYPYQGDAKKYPPAFDIIGWIVSVLPLFIIPLCAILALRRFKKMKVPLAGLFMIQRQHPSYERISLKWSESKRVIGDQLPEHEPGEEEMELVDGNATANDEESVIE